MIIFPSFSSNVVKSGMKMFILMIIDVTGSPDCNGQAGKIKDFLWHIKLVNTALNFPKVLIFQSN